MKKETWKPVVGYEGFYEVSDKGRVRSLDRIVKRRAGGDYTHKGTILKGGKSKSGYTSVVLSKDSHSQTHTIHRLVMRAFVGECPEGCEVAHLQNVKQGGTNELSNLIYCSRSCNHAFKADDGTGTIGSQHPGAKLNEIKVLAIRRLWARGVFSQHKIASFFNVGVMTINRIVNKKLWNHI